MLIENEEVLTNTDDVDQAARGSRHFHRPGPSPAATADSGDLRVVDFDAVDQLRNYNSGGSGEGDGDGFSVTKGADEQPSMGAAEFPGLSAPAAAANPAAGRVRGGGGGGGGGAGSWAAPVRGLVRTHSDHNHISR